MDKNTITGLVLIAIVLVVFSFLSRPSQEQLELQQQYLDSIARIEQREKDLRALAEETSSKKSLTLEQDSTALFYGSLSGTEQTVTISNSVLSLDISTLGGAPASVLLKDYTEQGGARPLALIKKGDMDLDLTFHTREGILRSRDLYFSVADLSESSVTLRIPGDDGASLDITYSLRPGSYLVDMDIRARGLASRLDARESMDIDWRESARQIERGYTFEQRLSQLTYRTQDDVDELSASGDDQEDVKKTLTWAAFKNQFFSSVLISDGGLTSARLSSKAREKGSGYIKDYSASFCAPFDASGQQPTRLSLYFGPNHYKTLSALDDGTHPDWKMKRLVYLGWPLLRWINQFFTINVFDYLTRLGLSMGWVLLLMTLIIKLLILPTTWKTYISSAKMKVLKPKVEAINQKYPDPADNMKKQQEVMTLYSQYRVSPMGGCLPMLIQFPILMALFMFVPSAIELRGQSFLWADDLSTYDAIVSFPFSIPLLGDHLSLFCILMTVTNLLYMMFTMKMQDTGANPQMAAMKWMSYLMPIIFLFVLNDYPSGLNYYYFLSTLLSVITMTIMRKMTNETQLLAKLEAGKKDAKQMRKTGFAARLEAIQKQQEELERLKRQKTGGAR